MSEQAGPSQPSERIADAAGVDEVFLRRWSPRSWSSKPVSDEQLATLFEAARWTPSWFNNQPWYFLYATKQADAGSDNGDDHEAFVELLMEGNRTWAKNAPVIGLVVAHTKLEGFMGRSHEFDTGAAAMALTLQATMMGLSVHLMGGVEIEAAHSFTGIDANQAKIVCAFVLGYRGDGSDLDEALAEREKPSAERKPSSEFAFRATKFPPQTFDPKG